MSIIELGQESRRKDERAATGLIPAGIVGPALLCFDEKLANRIEFCAAINLQSQRVGSEAYQKAGLVVAHIFSFVFEAKGLKFPDASHEEFTEYLKKRYLTETPLANLSSHRTLRVDWQAAYNKTESTMRSIRSEPELSQVIEVLAQDSTQDKNKNDLPTLMGACDMYDFLADKLFDQIAKRSH